MVSCDSIYMVHCSFALKGSIQSQGEKSITSSNVAHGFCSHLVICSYIKLGGLLGMPYYKCHKSYVHLKWPLEEIGSSSPVAFSFSRPKSSSPVGNNGWTKPHRLEDLQSKEMLVWLDCSWWSPISKRCKKLNGARMDWWLVLFICSTLLMHWNSRLCHHCQNHGIGACRGTTQHGMENGMSSGLVRSFHDSQASLSDTTS